MFKTLGYSESIFEEFSFGNFMDFAAFGECAEPTCVTSCVNCKDSCNHGPDAD